MGRKKTSPGRQAEGQITSDGADGKKTGRRKKRWRSIRKKTPPKNPAKPWFSNRQIYVGFGTVLTLDERSKNIRPWESRQEFLFQHLPEPHDRIWRRSRMSSNSTASLPRGEP
jgi:hypothetical protein